MNMDPPKYEWQTPPAADVPFNRLIPTEGVYITDLAYLKREARSNPCDEW